jgi:hypothetical protein
MGYVRQGLSERVRGAPPDDCDAPLALELPGTAYYCSVLCQ